MAEDSELADIAWYYQSEAKWHCQDCASFTHPLDRIIAWRPYPPDSVDPPLDPNALPPWKSSMAREYLVKWQNRSYRRTQWVPHMWLVSTSQGKLKNFLTGGTKVRLAAATPGDDMAVDTASEHAGDSRSNSRYTSQPASSPLDAIPDAESRIPEAWKTADRVLSVLLWRAGSQKATTATDSESDCVSDDEYKEEHRQIFAVGEEPPQDLTESISGYEKRTGHLFTIDDIQRVVWAFIKWDDLGYEEGTSPLSLVAASYDS